MCDTLQLQSNQIGNMNGVNGYFLYVKQLIYLVTATTGIIGSFFYAMKQMAIKQDIYVSNTGSTKGLRLQKTESVRTLWLQKE